MTRRDEFVELQGAVGRETDKAIQFTPDGGELLWLPLSQVTEIHRDDNRIVVTRWIASEKGLA